MRNKNIPPKKEKMDELNSPVSGIKLEIIEINNPSGIKINKPKIRYIKNE
jgi:hypothetical protein